MKQLKTKNLWLVRKQLLGKLVKEMEGECWEAAAVQPCGELQRFPDFSGATFGLGHSLYIFITHHLSLLRAHPLLQNPFWFQGGDSWGHSGVSWEDPQILFSLRLPWQCQVPPANWHQHTGVVSFVSHGKGLGFVTRGLWPWVGCHLLKFQMVQDCPRPHLPPPCEALWKLT